MSSSIEILNNESYAETCLLIRKMGFVRFPRTGYSRVVFCNGCFDVLHLGHLRVLAHAREIAGQRGAVVVGINSDQSVKRLKGDDRPIFSQEERGTMLVALRYVDHVISFEEDTPLELIRELRPDMIVKGGDYQGKKIVGQEIAPVSIVPLADGFSTSSIIERMKR